MDIKTKIFEVNTYIHTHWDREWYMEYESFRLRLLEVFDNILNALKTNKLDSFYFDGQIRALVDYLEIRKEKMDEVKKLINQKKLFIGPYYVSSDSFLVNPEFYLRNLEYGIDIAKNEFGCLDFICYIADSFGHSRFLPYIISYFGINYAILWRGLEEKIDSFFCWNNIVTLNLKRGYFQNQLMLDIDYKQKAQLIENELKKIIKDNDKYPVLLPLGGDHLNIPEDVNYELSNINKFIGKYKLNTGLTLFDVFKSLNPEDLKQYKDKEFRSNDSTFMLDGVLSTRNDLKYQNAKTQKLLSTICEPFIAFLNLLKLSFNTYEDELKYAYIETIKNHAHDSLYGCNIDNVNDEIYLRYKKAQTIAKWILNTQIAKLENIGNSLTVFNLGQYDFQGCVKLKTDKKIKGLYLQKKEKGFALNKLYNSSDVPLTQDYKNIYTYLIPVKNIKPFSVTKIDINHISNKNDLKITQNSLENENIRIEVLNGKINILNKQKNKLYEDMFIISDAADIGDSYNFGPLKNDKNIYAVLSQYKIVKNSCFCALKAKYNIKIPKNSNSKFRTKSCYNTSINVDYILETESKLIKAKIQFKNRSKNHKLEFGLRLNTYKENELYCEDLLGITKREIDLNYNIYNEIPAKKGVELKTNVVPFNRFIYFDGVGIITYGLHSAQLNQEGLFLNLLRSTGIISNPDNPSRGTSAGPPLKAYKNYMLKDVVAKFAICFEDDVYNMYKNTNTYYRPIVCLHSDIENTQFFNVKNDSIKVLNIKIKQNILTMRLCNSKPHSNQTVIDNLFMSDKCCFYEEDIKNKSRKIIKDGIINFKPYEIKTLSVI